MPRVIIIIFIIIIIIIIVVVVVVVVDDDDTYWVLLLVYYLSSHHPLQVYYKEGQVLLQIAISQIILLRSATGISKCATIITKCDRALFARQSCHGINEQ